MKYAEYALVALFLAAIVHNYAWIRRLKEAIAQRHPRHPEIDQFRALATPVHLVLNLVRFNHSRALFDLPPEERKALHLQFRFQLFILASLPVLLLYILAYLIF